MHNLGGQPKIIMVFSKVAYIPGMILLHLHGINYN